MLLSLWGCKESTLISDEENLLTDYVRSDAVPVYDFISGEVIMPETYSAYTEAVTEFSLRLLANSATEGENTLVAPAAVASDLSLCANGAGSAALNQLNSTLAGGEGLASLNTNTHYLNSRLRTLNTDQTGYTATNSLWFNDKFDVKAAFLQSAKNYYDAGLFRLDFSQENTKEKINGWTAEATQNKVTNAVDSVGAEEMALILSTVRLADGWTTNYTTDRLTEGTFHGAKGDTQVTFMEGEEFYISSAYGEGIIKSFASTPLRFGAILPPEGTSVEELVTNLTYNRYAELLSSQTAVNRCAAKLPEFSAFFNGDLKQAVSDVGLDKCFGKEGEFTSLSNTSSVSFDRIIQDASLYIGPMGTVEAETMTDLGSGPVSEELEKLTFDRPFLYFVFDNESNIPVFMGVVSNIE